MNYELLPDEFDKNTFRHKLIRTQKPRKISGKPFGSWRIYERWGLKSNFRSENHKNHHFEVVFIQVCEKERVFPNGLKQPPHEFYPSPEDWGLYGFTYSTLKEAEEKYNKVALTVREMIVEFNKSQKTLTKT